MSIQCFGEMLHILSWWRWPYSSAFSPTDHPAGGGALQQRAVCTSPHRVLYRICLGGKEYFLVEDSKCRSCAFVTIYSDRTCT